MSDIRLVARESAGSVARVAAGGYRGASGTRDGALFVADWLRALAHEGRVFIASDADANDAVLGQTSFADTTPTFLLRVPSGTTAIPIFASLQQSGSVAGGAITVTFEIDNADPYASGGTAETILSTRTDQPFTPGCSLYSNPTVTTGNYGVQVDNFLVGPDISSAEGAINRILWTPPAPIFLVGPASKKIYTYAASTGPTWQWAIGWAEIPTTAIQ